MSWRKVVGSLVLLLCITAGIFYLQKLPSVMVTHPTRGQAIEAVYATGTVESSITIRIAAERAARLIALLAD
ncbi:MAG: hypothetical protein PHD18_10765, partial [Tolumonas sp.]|nr:hypothetical protein [Tolumonas sp.]